VRVSLALGGALVALLLAAPAASATDAYVDQDTGDDANIGTNCQQTDPCETIGGGITAASNLGGGNTIRVDDSATAYLTSVTLFSSMSLVADDFVDGVESADGRPVIRTSGGAAIFISTGTGSDAGTISGFRFQPNDLGAITVIGDAVSIEDNVFEDPGASGNDVGITVGGHVDSIKGNSFSDLKVGMSISGTGTITIEDNELADSRNAAIASTKGTLVLDRNFIHGVISDGIALGGVSPTTQAVAVTTHRNRIVGGQTGVNMIDVAGPVSLNDDLITGGTLYAIGTLDSNDDGDTQLSATNLTAIADDAAPSDISVDSTDLTLDSSVVGDHGIFSGGDAGCSISFSRGPTTAPGASGCGGFQTTADPGLVDPGGGDFHLAAGSAMVDAGNPAAPPAGTLDIDGDARVLEGDGACPLDPRRDIGADELVAALPDCSAPQTSITGGPKARVKTRGRRFRASFRFSSSEGGSSFQCALDRGAFKPCTSPKSFKLKPGKHTFRVRARDAAGNLDATPATRTVRVKRKRRRHHR
jgi:hypothetical protein